MTGCCANACPLVALAAGCVVIASFVATGGGASNTTTPAVPVTPSVLALIVVVPADIAVTVAVVSLIAATAGFELAHLIGKPLTVLPDESMTVTVACVFCPTRNCDDTRLTSNTLTFSGLLVIASEWHATTARTIRNRTTRQRDA